MTGTPHVGDPLNEAVSAFRVRQWIDGSRKMTDRPLFAEVDAAGYTLLRPDQIVVPAEALRTILDYLELYEALDWTDAETEAYQALCQAFPKDATTQGQHRPAPSGAGGEHS